MSPGVKLETTTKGGLTSYVCTGDVNVLTFIFELASHCDTPGVTGKVPGLLRVIPAL